MEKTTSDERSQVGFSLLELIVVMVILGLLAGIVGVRVFHQQTEAKRNVAKLQISMLDEALGFFFVPGRAVSNNPGRPRGLNPKSREH